RRGCWAARSRCGTWSAIWWASGSRARSTRGSAPGRLLLAGLERQADRVHAEPVARRGLGSVVEHVAQVRPAARAAHLRAHHAEAAVGEELDAVARERAEEARPPAVRVELGVRAEELVAARPTRVDADALLV